MTSLEQKSLKWLLWLSIRKPQTREQTLGGTFLWYEKSILGCWLWVGLGCGIKGLGRLWATFEGGFFNFLREKKKKKKIQKNCNVYTEKLQKKKEKKKRLVGEEFFISVKPVFFMAKNTTESKKRSGPD